MQEQMTAAQFRAKYAKKSNQVEKPKAKRGPYANVNSGWYQIGGLWTYFRAGWEYKFAVILEHWLYMNVISSWEHEPRFFEFDGVKHGVTRYKPDFCAHWRDNGATWYEVKGRLNSGDLKKIKLFREQYDQETLVIVDQKWFRVHPQYKNLPGLNQRPIAKKTMLPPDAQFRSDAKKR